MRTLGPSSTALAQSSWSLLLMALVIGPFLGGIASLLRLGMVLKEILVFLDIKTYLENRTVDIKIQIATQMNDHFLSLFRFNQIITYFYSYIYNNSNKMYMIQTFYLPIKNLFFLFIFLFIFYFSFIFYFPLIPILKIEYLHHISHQMIEIPNKTPLLS